MLLNVTRACELCAGVLHLWRTFHCVPHSDHHMRWDHHCSMLLPAVQWGTLLNMPQCHIQGFGHLCDSHFFSAIHTFILHSQTSMQLSHIGDIHSRSKWWEAPKSCLQSDLFLPCFGFSFSHGIPSMRQFATDTGLRNEWPLTGLKWALFVMLMLVGLPLVVEVIYDFRIVSNVPPAVLHVLFFHEIGYEQGCAHSDVLRVHVYRVLLVLHSHRHYWLCSLLVLCSSNICLGEDRLVSQRKKKQVAPSLQKWNSGKGRLDTGQLDNAEGLLQDSNCQGNTI